MNNENENVRKRRIKNEKRREKRKEKKQKKKRNKNIFFDILILFFLVLMLVSGRYILKYYLDVKKNKDISNEIEQIINEKTKDNKVSSINLSKLKEKNKDSKFILDFPNTGIKNVVVQTNNNDYYISHDFNKKYNMSGWIFADYRNKLNGEDLNIIIYGHNMRDGKTMFSPLMKLVRNNYINNMSDKDKIIYISNDKKVEKYKIFSIYQDKDENINLRTPVIENELKKYALEMQKRSMYNFKEDISEIKKMITLATCGKTNADRVIIHAYKIK